jgi:hypothetical protein
VIEDRIRRGDAEGAPGTLARAFRLILGPPRDAAIPRRRPPKIEPVHRSWLATVHDARAAVHAGVTLDEHLRGRLAHYVAALPVSTARLPLEIEVEDGSLAIRTSKAPPPPIGPGGPDGWLDALVEAEGPAVRQEVADLEVRAVLLDGAVENARSRAEELSRRFAADVSVGAVMGETAVEASAEQMGRPPVRSVVPAMTLGTFAAAALLAATWQIARPLLRAAGLDPDPLDALALRAPAVAFTLLFALAVAVGIFGLLHGALAAALALVRSEPDPQRRGALQAGGAGQALAAALVASAVAALPLPDAPGTPPWTFVVLLLAVPLAAALAVRASRAETTARAAELAEALAWDRERARGLADRGRRLDEIAWAERLERELRAEREACRRRLREIGARAVAAARREEEARRREADSLSRLAHSIFAALEADRIEFLRQSAARGVVARRRPPEPRPVVVERASPPEPGQAAAS